MYKIHIRKLSTDCLAWALVIGCASSLHAEQLSFTAKPVVIPSPLSSDASTSTVVVEPSVGQTTAVCFLGTQCPMARGYVGTLNRLHADYAERGVRIIGVMSNRQDSVEDIAQAAQELGIVFPLVRDADNVIADRYGASRTPEVFLLDSQVKLRYRGRIDDRLAPGVARAQATREDLRLAIDELLAGKPVSIPATRALGCIIGRVPQAKAAEADASAVTYYGQVARVLNTHCVECHRAGEIGPFAMDDFDEVVGWAETMLETVDNGRMPPWHADPAFGSFSNERTMPEADKQILRDWIRGGLAKGEVASLPPSPTFVDGWNLPRQPDQIVAMRQRPFVVPRDGAVEYQYFVSDPGFTEDKWITAAQVIPGSRSVVHHAIVFVRPPDGAEFNGIGWLTAYVPGQRIYELPSGRARKVPAGSKFVFQMHYTPNGTETADVTQLGLLFGNPEEVTHEVFTWMALDQEFEIPPGEENFSVRVQSDALPAGADLLAITPHMHLRGKSFRMLAKDGNTTEILSVPNYDFNWQHTYQLAQPLPVETLGSLRFETVFDNSDQNPFNPDPTQIVTWGDQTWEEMAVAFFEVSRPLTADSTSRSAKRNSQASPQSAEDRSLKIEQYVARVFEELDSNQDGQINKSEGSIVVRHMHFKLWDLNEDNVATADEVHRAAEKLF